MKKAFIISAYIVFFWIIIPFILIYSSAFLDDILHFAKFQTSSPLVAGIAILTLSVPLLVISIL